MMLCALPLIALAAQVSPQPAEVLWPESGSLAVGCALGHTTRIVLPEPLKRLRTLGPDRQALTVAIERAAPTAVISLRAERHPARCALEFHGTTRVLRLEVTTMSTGNDQEISLALPAVAPAAGAPATPTPPPPTPTPTPAAPRVSQTPAPARETAHDLAAEELPWARAVPIGRRAGLPGQPPLILEDALETGAWIWYRLRLVDGAAEELAEIEWEHGPLTSYIQAREGQDRRILVRVPRKLVTRRTKLTLRLASGVVYRVPPRPATLGGLFGRLF